MPLDRAHRCSSGRFRSCGARFVRMLRLFAYTLVLVPLVRRCCSHWKADDEVAAAQVAQLARSTSIRRSSASTLLFAVIWVFIVALAHRAHADPAAAEPPAASSRGSRGRREGHHRQRSSNRSAMRPPGGSDPCGRARCAWSFATRSTRREGPRRRLGRGARARALAGRRGGDVRAARGTDRRRHYKVRRLTTVGAAVVLLGADNWPGRSTPVPPGRASGWRSTTRPAPSERARVAELLGDLGSVLGRADRRQAGGRCERRWRGAYFPELDVGPRRPRRARGAQHEPAVPRPLAVLREHRARSSSRPRCNLLGDDYPRPPAGAWRTSRTGSSVIAKKSLGANMLAAVVIAAIVPGLPPRATQFFARVLSLDLGLHSAGVIDFFPGGRHPRSRRGRCGGRVVAFITETRLDSRGAGSSRRR